MAPCFQAELTAARYSLDAGAVTVTAAPAGASYDPESGVVYREQAGVPGPEAQGFRALYGLRFTDFTGSAALIRAHAALLFRKSR